MKGLTGSQAESFLKQYGYNTISEPPKKNILIKFFEQFNNFLTILLIAAAVLSYFLGEGIDGGLIIAIVILNAFFGLYQEAKAEQSLKALKEMTVTKVRVIRDGQQVEIDSKFLVPGDIVYIEEGVKLPADGHVIETINLEVNESALTGESLAIGKKLKDEVYSGTIVSRGRGIINVTKTGDLTKFGMIAKNLSSIVEGQTPLQKKLSDLTRFIGIGGIGLSLLVFVISMAEGSGYFPAFLLAISLAVAVVPEGLPAVMTITLSIGMKRMAGKKAILRRLSAIEALGSITLIATDKTGTLTTNRMQVKEVYVDGKKYQENSLPELANHPFNLMVTNGILCSTASLVYTHDHGSWDVLGDPTEGALLYLAQKKGVEIDEFRKQWKLLKEDPFNSVTKMMSVQVEKNDIKIKTVFSKGAPESILSQSKRILSGKTEKNLTSSEREKLEKVIVEWASQGLRVLAFSYNDGTFLGMVAIHDAPRPEVNEAISKAKRAGIKIVMVTGDSEKTAEAIGVSTGLLEDGDDILTGSQVEEYTDDELIKILPKVKIFARTNPFQKHRIVKLYQRLGEVVGVTGDGVNDAIALKQADVGVAMGLIGTDVARETADMVITDDNFATIVTAIEEGRGIINSIKNAIKYLLSCNVSEAIALIIGLLLGLPTLFYPIQLLYINLVTDGLPALMLAFSPRDPNLMSITPEKEMVLLKKKDQHYIVWVGLVGAILVTVSYFIYSVWLKLDLGKTAAFSVLTMIQSFVFIDLWLSHRHIHQNLAHLFRPLFVISFLVPIVLQFGILSHPFTASLFRISPVDTNIYFQFLLISFMVLLGVRLVKKTVKL
ncbi:MAG: cation-translocating P-type ATPase [Patescibacteria group bacterium]